MFEICSGSFDAMLLGPKVSWETVETKTLQSSWLPFLPTPIDWRPPPSKSTEANPIRGRPTPLHDLKTTTPATHLAASNLLGHAHLDSTKRVLDVRGSVPYRFHSSFGSLAHSSLVCWLTCVRRGYFGIACFVCLSSDIQPNNLLALSEVIKVFPSSLNAMHSIAEP
jgi:hypothetical protein